MIIRNANVYTPGHVFETGSILQLHPDCILVADEEALSLL